jgi:hypothetical protein
MKKKKQIKKTQNGESDRYKLQQACGRFFIALLPLLVVSGVLMSASYGSLIIASSTGRNLFLYGLLALCVFCAFLGFIPSSNSTLLSFYGARSRPGVFCQLWILINLQHHEKDREMTAREAFQNGISLVCFQHYGFFLGFGYNLTKWIKWKITWTRHLLTDRVSLHLGQDWKSERAFLLSYFFLLTKT